MTLTEKLAAATGGDRELEPDTLIDWGTATLMIIATKAIKDEAALADFKRFGEIIEEQSSE